MPLHAIGQYCCNTAGINANYNRDHLLVTPVIAGTLGGTDLQFFPTDYGNMYYPLPLFNFKDISDILEDCVSRNVIPRWSIGPFFHRLWWLLGLTPRSLKVTIRVVSQEFVQDTTHPIQIDSDTIVDDIHKRARGELSRYYSQRYQITEKTDQLLLHLSCTNMKYSIFDNWKQQIEMARLS